METVKVRIALKVDPEGHWDARGHWCDDGSWEGAMEHSDEWEDATRHWVEVLVAVPARPEPQTVQGKLVPA